jgi:hypothetical protein
MDIGMSKWRNSLISSQALEGKDVKDLLLNVGSGGGTAAAPAAGGAAASGDAPAEEKKEEKEEGKMRFKLETIQTILTFLPCREGGIRRRYGLRAFRLSLRRDQSILTSKHHRDISECLSIYGQPDSSLRKPGEWN